MQTPAHSQAVVSRQQRRRRANDRPRQIDLFADASAMDTPAWRDLPDAARGQLTDLMARLILEHARAGSSASRTGADHDH
jgi:hypothetical protein